MRAQLLSDVPVGAFLSAGLDSSSIAAAMAAATDQPVHTYTIAFADRHRRGETTLDDVTVARRTAEHFGCRHTTIVVEPDVADLLPKLAWHMDEPTADPALIMAYDRELAEWVAWNVPPSAKLHGATTKHLLREAMRPVLPAEVLRQAKAGFGAPIDFWLANELRPMVDALLSESAVQRRGLFHPSSVQCLVQEQRRGRQDWSFQVWQLLTLELWFRVFID